MSSGLLRPLAAYAAGLRVEALPPEVVARANLCVMDLIGSTYAALGGRGAQALARYAAAVNPTPQATLWGTRQKAGAIEVATANGANAYEAEYDDGNTLGGHWGSSAIPAILALAERDGRGAQDVLPAIVAAYEIGDRVSRVVSRGLLARGVHYPGALGGVGATAGAGRMLRLDEEDLSAALGFTCLLPVAPYFPGYEGADAKNLYSGWPNHCGLHFTALAASGYRGSPQLLEGRDGLAHVLGWQGSAPDLEARLLNGLGERHAILDTYFKPYPCCRWIHAPVRALLDMLRQGPVAADAIERIEVAAPAFLGRMYFDAGPFTGPTQGKYSVPFCLAAAALRGELGQAEFAPAALADPRIHALARRVTFVEAPDLEQAFPPDFSVRVTVRAADGRTSTGRGTLPWGPQQPPGFADLAAKFRAIMEPLCGPALAGTWMDYFASGLEADPSLDVFFRLLRESVVPTR